jgi:molybdopterin-guanine dinucleotide biosynthesis protein A
MILATFTSMNFTVIILAGGQSSRMGSNKALTPFFGKPLIVYSIDVARLFTGNILISANNHDLDYLGFPVVKDELKVRAPLAGIHAGLRASNTDWNLILSCDMPNITKALLERLSAGLDQQVRMVLPLHDGFIEPLCGFYHRDLISLIERNFKDGKLSLLDLPGDVPHKLIDLADRPPEEIALLFKNVNEKKDLINFLI